MNVNPFSYLIEKLKGYVSKSGDTVFGDLTVNAENGTANVDAYTYLKVGNQTPKSSAKHSTGLLRLCGENGRYTDIYAPNSTASRDIVLPNASGTVALTSDLKKTTVQYALSDYYKDHTWYRISAPTGHTYLFATLNDWTSGSLNTSPFSILYNGTYLYIMVGSVEPLNVTVDFWYFAN